MSWQQQLRGDSLSWLLETDSPGVRYLALRDLVDAPGTSELSRARTGAHKRGPIAQILGSMEKEGYWVKPGPGYDPKYRAACWSLMTLAQLGASVTEDRRILRAC